MRRLNLTAAACLACAATFGAAGVADAGVRVAAPQLAPKFKAAVHDYTLPASACSKPFPLVVRATGATAGRIGAGRPFRGLRTRRLRLTPGQAVPVLARTGRRSTRYYVRCLPKDFPAYRYRSFGRARTPFFVVTVGHYVAIFDRNGVPVWWHRGRTEVIDGKVLPGGLIAFARYFGGGYGVDKRIAYELRRPNGKLVRTLRARQAITDFHELQPTPDGNFVLLSYKKRPNPIDLSAFNGDADATVLDAVIQKLSPTGKRLWSWNSKHHIGLAETGRFYEDLEEPYDIVHVNSIQPLAGNDYLVSFRHTDSVYRIDGATGDVEWKLGGTPTPRSLQVVGDPLGGYPLGAQHDARMLPDGTITIHDNGSDLSRPPRSLRYRLEGDTATLVGSQFDKGAPSSFCCGSSRLAGGAWLTSWGGTPLVSEFFRGRRTFSLRFLDEDAFSYRANTVTRETGLGKLRRGMNLMTPPKR